MTIEGLSIEGAASIPVTLSGRWSPLPKRDWRGVATAPEPIVGITFLQCSSRIEWCLSERPEGCTLEVRILLLSGGQDRSRVAVNIGIGRSGRRSNSRVLSPDYRPCVPLSPVVQTGRVVHLARVEGDPCVDFLGLFLAKRDTRTAKKGIWHLHSPLREGIPSALKGALTYGRKGHLDASGEGLVDAGRDLVACEDADDMFKKLGI